MRLADMKVAEYKTNGRPVVRRFARVVMIGAMTSMLGACSTMDSAGDKVVDYASTLNPLNWFGDDDDRAKQSGGGGTTENAEGEDSDSSDAKRKSRSGKVPSGTLYGDNRAKKYPKLGTIPDSPKAHKSLKRQLEREKLAQGLVADTKNAQYTEQVLRARLAVKPPPPTASPTTPVAAQQVNAPSVSPPSAPAVARSSRITPSQAPTVRAPSAPRVQAPVVRAPAVPAAPQAPTVAPSAVASSVPLAPPAPPYAPAPRITKAVAPSAVPQAQPAVARVAPPARPAQPGVPAPSAVPPPPPPSAYQTGGPPQRFATPSGVPQAAVVQAPPIQKNVTPPPVPPRYTERPVVTATPPARAVSPPAQVAALPAPTYGAPQTLGGQKPLQVATIYFGNGSSRLGARDRVVVQDVVSMYRETGGLIRIIGHSSGFAASQGSGRSKLVNFKVSLDRANAVAAELIRRGVPPDRIDVSAQGTESPRYAEYSPTGEAGNRRAEVFLDYANGS